MKAYVNAASDAAQAAEPRGRVVLTVPGMGSGHADVTLISGELTKVVEAIRLSQLTFRKIVQNMAFRGQYTHFRCFPGTVHPFLRGLR
jgi:hypothetical protein